LVLKSVPEHLLEAEVEGLADRMARIDPELLSTNKRIINLGVELMGAQTLQRLAAENDARAHTAPAVGQAFKQIREEGVRKTVADRDAPFGDGRARVIGPEIRDAEGNLQPL
jgi:enoyl-CoA hydratase